jgi:hypothetical protein
MKYPSYTNPLNPDFPDGYVIRLPANNLLQKEIEHLLTRPVGRPLNKPNVFYEDFPYHKNREYAYN